MVGFQKIAEPIFNYVAKSAIKKGHLNELMEKYCKETFQIPLSGLGYPVH